MLYNTDDITPPIYQPPFFIDADPEMIGKRDRHALKIKLGSIHAPHCQMNFKFISMMSDDNLLAINNDDVPTVTSTLRHGGK